MEYSWLCDHELASNTPATSPTRHRFPLFRQAFWRWQFKSDPKGFCITLTCMHMPDAGEHRCGSPLPDPSQPARQRVGYDEVKAHGCHLANGVPADTCQLAFCETFCGTAASVIPQQTAPILRGSANPSLPHCPPFFFFFALAPKPSATASHEIL